MTKRPPGQRRIGARIRIKAEYAALVATAFETGGFHPIYVEHRSDEAVSFWFDKVTAKDPGFVKVVLEIPLDYWAIVCIVGGPTFH